MPEATTKPDPKAKEIDPTQEFAGPPEEEFWERYNKRLEFPLSSVATVLLHVLVGTLIALILLQMENKEDRSSVGVMAMDVGGLDDFGAGSQGGGGREDPLVERINADPATAEYESLADLDKFPEVKEQTVKLIDPSGTMPITRANIAAYKAMDKAMADRLFGAQRGTGNTPGKGVGLPGTGPGGSGADSTLGRNLRWTLRFRVNSGRDYLNQLKTMGAKILVPKPGTEQCVVVDDLSNPTNHRVLGKDDLGPYIGLLKFADSRAEAVGGVAGVLELDFRPKTFFAVFSKDFELDLSRKEKAYQNKRPEQIEETVFKVSVGGGSYDVQVELQKLR
jgi:hypothetical protein